MDTDFPAWFAGKSFSTDWTSRFFALWASLLESRRHEPLEVLEIGSWEGRSAIFFLRYLDHCRLTCIDTFRGNAEHQLRPKWRDALPHVEQRFDSNLAEFGGRVEKIKHTSSRALARLSAAGRRFDVVLIDGSHRSEDVEADATHCWPMVKDGGIVIFDDYEWTFFSDATEHPKLGVDRFLQAHAGQYRERHREYQLIIEKIGDPTPRRDQFGVITTSDLKPMAPILKRAMTWLALIGVALAGLLLAATPWQMPTTGLDPSWWSAVEYAYLQGLVLGRDFSFTSGPLSFIYTRFFHPDTFLWVVLAVVHAVAIYTAVVYWSPHRRLAAVLIGWLALFWAPLSPDALYLSQTAAVFLLSITGAAPAMVVAVLVAGLALSSLAKFSVLLLGLPLFVLADVLALIERRPRYWHTVLYGVSFIAAYRAAGQPLSALPDFLIGSIDFAAGYGQAMANFTWEWHQTVLVVAAFALLAVAFFLMPRAVSWRSMFCVLGLAWYAFFAFKLGNVRAGHQQITWHALAAASFLLILLPVGQPGRRGALVIAGSILICAGVSQFFATGPYPGQIVSERAARLAAVVADATAWLGPRANIERLTQQRRAADERLALQAPRDLVGTVGSLPWEFSELIAAGVRFVPSPALQTYSNYTPRLRRLTAQHFASDARPENLFFELATIDGRFRTIDLGPALISILAGYDLTRKHGRILGAPMQLRSRAHRRSVEVRALESKTARMGDWVDAPRLPDRGLMLAVRLRENAAGKMLTLLYKQEPFWIDLRFASGTVISARAFPNLVSDGFLVLPPEMTDAQLFAEVEGRLAIGESNPLAAFRVRPTRLGALRFSADYAFEASAVGIAGRAEHPISPETPAATAMQALIEGRVIESPEVRVIEGRLLAHAPSKIVAAMPKGRRLMGEIGFFDGAWREGSPGPVTFAISRLAPTGARLLFEKTLDPKANPADRGPQKFSIDLGPDGSSGEPTELLFETRPGTGWGWTYWSQLQLEE